MSVTRGSLFKAQRAWGSYHIGTIDGVTAKVHWTDEPYIWHVNDGNEVFAVLSGSVLMHHKVDGLEVVERLEPGDVFFADVGCEHFAEPIGEARVLVFERDGSI